MSHEGQDESRQAAQKLVEFVIQEMRAGNAKPEIVQKLTGMGVEPDAASRLVEHCQTAAGAAQAQQQVTMGSLLPAIAAAAAAAVVGGLVWGYLVIWTGFEIGYVAWGLGVLAGLAVVFASRGRRGMPLQVLAVASAVFGIVIGKYIIFYDALVKIVTKEDGPSAAAEISMFSASVMNFFVENIGSMVGGFDILWVILALGSAWSIPKARGLGA